jgi:hypothetical protein
MAGARRLANEVRTGLEDAVVTRPAPKLVVKAPVLDAQWMGKSVRDHVREFGAIFATIFLGIASYKLYREGFSGSVLTWGVLGVIVAALGYRAPIILHPIWKGWMKLAHYLSIVMTFVILSVAWTLGFVPMSYLLRILGIKRIDLRYGEGVDSYWELRDPKYDDFKRLEQQF